MEKPKYDLQVLVLKPMRGNHGGLSIRFPYEAGLDLLNDWNAWKRLMTDWGVWLRRGNEVELEGVDTSEVKVVKHNGLMGPGKCPACGYMHVEILPLSAEPMLCPKALALKKTEITAKQP
jgi:hypothetical protein